MKLILLLSFITLSYSKNIQFDNVLHYNRYDSIFLYIIIVLLIIILILIILLYSKFIVSKKLKQRIEFDHVLLNSIDSPIFWKDTNGKILDANKKFCDLIDISYNDLHNKKLNDFQNVNAYISKILLVLKKHEQNNQKHSQFSLVDQNKQKRIFFMNTTTYIDSISKEDACVVLLTDTTKKIQLENERIKQTQYMIQESKLADIGEIFSSIAHQWKSPLVAITSLAQDLFYSSNTNIKEQDSYHINNIMLQVKYMTKTINDFQDFIIPSKQKTLYDVKDTITTLLNIVNHNMKYNYINITTQIESNTNLKVYGYENELMQVILNIINNAKDALLNNHRNNRNIDIIVKNKSNYISINIIDNAGGIEEEMKKKIFLQYFSTKNDGHGIGLYMTKIIVEDKMNGSIIHKNTKNGSSFIIKIQQGSKNENFNS